VDHFDPSSVTEYACLNADDDPGYPILDLHFATTKEFMDRALQRPDSQILVHCMAGINRSATLVLAYVSQRDTTSTLQKVERFARYFDIVMIQRPIILMNEGFYEQLLDWIHDRPVRTRTNPTFFAISNIL
jgi:protein-tyrosine phosphatase